MFPAFLAQYAAGCFLAVTVSAIKLCGWRYLRLMSIVSTAIAMLALLAQVIELGDRLAAFRHPAVLMLALGVISGFGGLFLNAIQNERVLNSQRITSGIAGVACLAAAFWLAIGPTPSTTDATTAAPAHVVQSDGPSHPAASNISIVFSTLLGAAIMGVATTAMLLGHRYLTDTDMPIAPLKWITNIYIVVVVARIISVAIGAAPLWTGALQWSPNLIYPWLALSIRVGVGIVVAGIFAWMVWDCVKRRATQSATALYYLSMLLIFFGELSAQYLMRTEGLAL